MTNILHYKSAIVCLQCKVITVNPEYLWWNMRLEMRRVCVFISKKKVVEIEVD